MHNSNIFSSFLPPFSSFWCLQQRRPPGLAAVIPSPPHQYSIRRQKHSSQEGKSPAPFWCGIAWGSPGGWPFQLAEGSPFAGCSLGVGPCCFSSRCRCGGGWSSSPRGHEETFRGKHASVIKGRFRIRLLGLYFFLQNWNTNSHFFLLIRTPSVEIQRGLAGWEAHLSWHSGENF